MLFSSTVFIFGFLFAVLLIYYGLLRGNTARNIFLFAASVFFYAWGEPRFVFMLLISIAVNWGFGLWTEKNKRDGKSCSRILALMAFYNLFVIAIFKYAGFFIKNLNAVFDFGLPVPRIALPIGISFFTFQAISYVVDIYRGRGEAQKSMINVGLYISFFPQLIAGPIVRYETIAAQIKVRKEEIRAFSRGVCRFITGLAKKVLISNQMAVIADRAFDGGVSSVGFAWLGAIAYAFQIFYDFSGYSDMAIGLGKMFGFEFEENFDYPYISKSVSEFWRRWHISLGTWFRDYVYIPLGGSRAETKGRRIFNLFAVWFLTGLWHGASWNFVLWGLYFFVLIIIEKFVIKNNGKRGLAGNAYTLLAVVLGWVLFRAETLPEALLYFSRMAGIGATGADTALALGYIKEKGAFLLAAAVFSVPVGRSLEGFTEKVCRNGKRAEAFFASIGYVLVISALFVISVAFLAKGTYNPFIYFNF